MSAFRYPHPNRSSNTAAFEGKAEKRQGAQPVPSSSTIAEVLEVAHLGFPSESRYNSAELLKN